MGAMIGTINTDLLKLLVSMVLGAAVGVEREFNEKPAGLKTNVLICIGSTLFTIVSEYAFQNPTLQDYHIAAQIVTGIGFLGAGAIMREGERVTGLTTAALIWVVAAIGMAVGMGHFLLATVATFGSLLVQIGLGQMDIFMDRLRQRHTFKLVTLPETKTIDAIERVFQSHEVHVMNFKVMKKNNLYYSEWWTAAPAKCLDSAADELLKSDEIVEVSY